MRDTVREVGLVEVRDTVREVTTITIRENEQGDTLRFEKVTDRLRTRATTDVRNRTEGLTVERDSTAVQKDSVSVEDKKIGLSASAGTEPSGKRGKSVFLTALKWIFAIICAIIVLIITIKVCLRRLL